MSFFFRFEEKLSLEVFIIYYTIWILFSLMETNRAPFDLLEGERELIRGFNIEIRSLLFIFLFLREYGIIIVISCLGRITMTGKPSIILLVIGLITILFCRRCYPRIRYDILIRLIWKSLLPICLGWFLIIIVLV
jgi:NADH:ubiquinone oxidoreductase subunit H